MGEPIRVLHIVGNMSAGGMESLIMNWYRNIDRDKIQFDFLVHSKSEAFYESEIIAFGGKVYHLSFSDDKKALKYIQDLNGFFNTHKEYKIVHGHHAAFGCFYLSAAKNAGVPFRIAHSHNGDFSRTLRGVIVHLLSRCYKYPSNIKFACSAVAGNYMFGKNATFSIINNGIDTQRFAFSEADREMMRECLGINGKTVLVHVGRFHDQKNHTFLIDVFEEVHTRINDSVLLLIGTGPLQTEIKTKVDSKGLSESVMFLNNRNDVEKILCASDVFVFPSLYEGLPLTLVEAQASGLPIICSDKITAETKLADHYYSLSLNDSAHRWADEVIKVLTIQYDRKLEYLQVKNQGYDTHDVATRMQKIYEDMYAKAVK